MFRTFPLLVGVVMLLLAAVAGPALESSNDGPAGANIPRVVNPAFTFGLHVKDDSFYELARAEQQLDRRADLFLQYNGIEGQFNARKAQQLAASGYSIVLTLEFWEKKNPDERFSLQRISSGAFDKEIDRWARDLKEFGQPIVLRPLHEFNGAWYPWGVFAGGNHVEDFVPAWRHIVDRFRLAGVSNVRFELCFARFHLDIETKGQKGKELPANPWASLWPGDDYVDMVGIDVFNRPPEKGNSWQTFDNLFARSYGQVSALSHKPIWIQEMASTGIGGDKATWIADAFKSIKTKYPRVASVTWFNYAGKKDSGWRFDKTPASLEALKAALMR